MEYSTSRYRLGDLCEFYRGASVPRTRMHDSGDYLYIHYGDLYKGFSYCIDVERQEKPIPYILSREKIKDEQRLLDQDIVYVLTSETVDDLGHSFLFNNPQHVPAVAGTETTIVRVKDRCILLPAYLNYLMHSPRFLKMLRQYVRGMKVFRVHPRDVARIEIELPAIETQRKIVLMLDAIHEKLLVNVRTNGYLGELCETIATHQTDTSAKLRDLCFQVNDKVPCTEAVIGSYVSTESLLVNKGGRQVASSLPAMGKVTEYKVGDTLVSNIRPYFKKIWFADQEGTCSGDVIVFRALEAQNAPYVYSILRTSSFFDWVMLGSKGTKMPRGDKKQMMNYPVSLSCKETDLELLSSATKWISSNERQNGRLSELRDVLLPKLMSGEIDVSKVEVPTQPNSHLSAD